MSNIQILLPILPAQEIYIRGYIFLDDCNIKIYITKYTTNRKLLSKNLKNLNNNICGYIGHDFPKKVLNQYENIIYMKQNSLYVSKLIINGVEVTNTESCLMMIYDYDNIKDSQTICTLNDDNFTKLVDLIYNEHGHMTAKDCKPNFKSPPWISTSMFVQHVYNYWRLLEWLLAYFQTEKISIKHGNLILAIVMDLVLGYVALQLLPQDNEIITSSLMGLLEKLIHFLYSLLKWLMGAPVGLKLNNAFNNMLGKYFSYHVQLWWLFLDVSGERLDIILHIYNYIGYLGFTFQIAIISDLICLATFHSYCIYVYAARLFNIQISGLIALLRLFVGRKYNPLRGGIDSCEYTNQELFVGTVAFTILLLLLPTTALYYVVFTGFRLVSLVVQNVLAKFIYLIQTSPIYTTILWLIGSSKVKGNILMEVINEDKNSLILRIRLTSKSMMELVRTFKPPVNIPNQVEWTNLLSNILVGEQIV